MSPQIKHTPEGLSRRIKHTPEGLSLRIKHTPEGPSPLTKGNPEGLSFSLKSIRGYPLTPLILAFSDPHPLLVSQGQHWPAPPSPPPPRLSILLVIECYHSKYLYQFKFLILTNFDIEFTNLNNGYIYLFQVKTMKFCPLKLFHFSPDTGKGCIAHPISWSKTEAQPHQAREVQKL